MGKDGENPRNRPVWYKTGMSSTTVDLFDGTTKKTYQVRLQNAEEEERERERAWARGVGGRD